MINEDRLYQFIGERLKQRRLDTNLTQSQLAETVGLLRTSITNLEGGRQKAPLHVLYDLCVALNIEIADLLPSKNQVSQNPEVIGGNTKKPSSKSAKILEKLMSE